MTQKIFKVIIIGAGPVGISLAVALANLPLHLTLLEANPIATAINIAERPLSLTYSSQQILAQLNLWQKINACATPIHQVHISDRGHFGFTRINAKDENVPALGYVVPAGSLANIFNAELLALANIQLLNPARLQNLEWHDNQWTVHYETNNAINNLQADLIIAADGTQSLVRKLLNIDTEIKDYQQSALVTTIDLSRDHKNVAYERFIEQGAIAMLPLSQQRMGCVWTEATDQINALHALSSEEFLARLQSSFGYRLGKLQKCNERIVHPLKKVFAKECVRPGLVLIGNAAHTLHPIAAQGFNLGLGDVKLLVKIIGEALAQEKNPGDIAVLKNYEQQRQPKVNWIMQFTDKLTRIFSHDFLPLSLARNSGLISLDLIPPLKKRLAKRLMGVQ
jgi:2-octaprenyl-6-methoxyphenol hydroxylase